MDAYLNMVLASLELMCVALEHLQLPLKEQRGVRQAAILLVVIVLVLLGHARLLHLGFLFRLFGGREGTWFTRVFHA